MAVNFPLSLDSLSNPSSGDKLDNPSHSTQHGDANDILEALETKLGIGASPAGSATAGFPLVHSSGGTTAWAQVGYEGITSGTATSGQVLTAGTATGTAIWNVVSALTTTQFLHIRDEKAATNQGGTFTNGAWRTRDLNTIKTNTITGASLSSNQITLPAGTYFIQGYPVSFRVEGNISRIYNITDSSQVSLGVNNHSGSVTTGSQGTSTVSCIVTITATKVFELQHYSQSTVASVGFGIRNETGVGEVYSEILIWKIG
jgi:hypothetical protein